MTAELHGSCHGCHQSRPLFSPNAPPRSDDRLLCGECWMVRAVSDGLALSAARRERDAACTHERTFAVRCNRSSRVLPLRITFGPDEAERLEWCVDCGAVKIIRIQVRASTTSRDGVWVAPGDPRAIAIVAPGEPAPRS